MKIDLSSGLAVVLTVLGIIALVAAALVYARASYVKEQLKALRDDRDDQEHRIDRQDQEIAQLKLDNDHLTGQLADEVIRREALEKIVTGREQLERLTALLEARTQLFTDLQAHLDRIEADIRSLVERQ